MERRLDGSRQGRGLGKRDGGRQRDNRQFCVVVAGER